jgi:glycerophosphoryl diester phosphodiesterase
MTHRHDSEVIVSAHDGYPRWVMSGADYVEVDVRRDANGVFILSHDEPKPREKAPTLDEALRATDGRIAVQLDLKESGYELELMQRCPRDRVVITSGDSDSIDTIKRSFPDVQVGLTRQYVERTAADFIALDHRHATEDQLAYCQRYAIPVWVWTVDDPRLMKRFMKDDRIKGIITNRPDLALKLRKARS